MNNAPITKGLKTDEGSVHFRDNWTAQITNEEAFFKYCAEEGFFDLWEVKKSGLNKIASLKKKNPVPGLRIWNDRKPINR